MKRLFILLTALLMSGCSGMSAAKPELQSCSPYPAAAAAIQVKAASAPEGKYSALNYESVRAIWISYLELAEIVNSGEETFRSSFAEICENCSDMGINTLYVHVRTFGDAFYPSKLYPYTKAFQGKCFDALAVMLDEAHKRKLSFHAWINPLRCETGDVLDGTSDSYKIKQWYSSPEKYDEYVVYVESTGHYWLDPAVDEVRELIADGVREIVSGYDVDGVHIDDYFYPTEQPFFDSGIYVEQGIEKPLNEWRLENCTKMVRQIYNAVKENNRTVEFGIAPQGNIENNYNYLFADVKLWCASEGYCDYICPQIYFGYENPYKPFYPTMQDWIAMCKESGNKLIIGIAAYKVNTEDEFTENPGIIRDQARQALDETDGAAFFSYNSFFKTDRGEQEREKVSEYYNSLKM